MIAPVLAVLPALAAAQTLEMALMPGEVIAGHAKFEHECDKCHQPFDKGAQTRLCLDCHKEVAADASTRTRLHGRLDDRTCRACHTEHKGRTAEIAPFDPKKFDHDKADFRLAGAHREARCESCHLPRKKYRQAPRQCNDCHAKDDDEKGHKGRLGPRCENCHDEQRWEVARFDHEKTKFSLLGGKHARVPCAKCHADRTYQRTPLTCNGCHRKDDQERGHKGRYGVKCESCHSDKGWKPSTFNHDVATRYALKGKHRPVVCAACHLPEKGGTIYEDKLSAQCIACHRADDRQKGHRGELGEKCESCHDERGWRDARFDHDRSKFPLLDKHRGVRCEACHVGGVSGADARIRVERTCFACHRADDEKKGHKGRYGDKCESCHSAKGWKTIGFDHDRDTRYPLRGGHQRAKCDACHLPDMGPIHKARLDTACVACHRKDDSHKGQLGAKCERCHDEVRWKGAPFDHNLARFPLTGSHARVECAKCHKDAAFRDAPSSCNGCHEKDDKHAGRFGARCDSCHYTGTWKTWDFDHSRTRFALDGAHRALRCALCHGGPAASAAKPARACVGCHSKDDVHEGRFGAQCERCHVVTDWRRSLR